jgi:hypothetical protein
MLNAAKPVHINLIQIGDETTTNSTGGAPATDSVVSTPGLTGVASLDLSGWEAVPGMGDAGVVGNAFKVMVQGMGSGPDPAVGSRATWRRASWIWFRNTGAVSLEISFDNGNSFITVPPVGTPSAHIFEASLAFRYFYVRESTSAGTHVGAFACIVGINQS